MRNCCFLIWFVCCLLFIATITSGAKADVTSEDFHYLCDSNNDRGNYTTLTTLSTSSLSMPKAEPTPLGSAEVTSSQQNSPSASSKPEPTSPTATGLWYENEKCMLRYSDRTITRLDEIGPAYFVWNLNNAPNAGQFNRLVKKLLDGLRDTAASVACGRKYAVSTATGPNEEVIFGLAQCTPDFTGPQCLDCLVQSIAELPRCCNNRIGARITQLLPGPNNF